MKCDLCNGTGRLEDDLKCWKCKGEGTLGWLANGKSFICFLIDLVLLLVLFCGGMVSLSNNQGVVTLYWWSGFGLLVAANLVYLWLLKK